MRGDEDVTDWREASLSSSIPSNLSLQQNLLSFLKRTKQDKDLQILFGIMLQKDTNLFAIAGWTKPRGEKLLLFQVALIRLLSALFLENKISRIRLCFKKLN